MVSDKRRISIRNYRQEKRDQLAVDVPKGKRDAYKQIAAELGISLSMLIQTAVETYGGKNHAGEDFKPASVVDTQPKLSQAEQKLISDFNRLPVDTQKAIAKLIQTINQNTQNQPE